MSEPTAKRPLASRLGRRLLTLGLLLLALVLTVATWANYRKDGYVSFRVFDSAWWGVGRDASKPYVDGAKDVAVTAYDRVWGTDGLVDQADAWLRREDPAPVPAPVEGSGDERMRHEQAFVEAQDRFEQGLLAWRAAKPPSPTVAPDREAVQRARADFTRVADLLDTHLNAYNTTPGKNLRVLKDAEDLQALNRRMLDQVNALR